MMGTGWLEHVQERAHVQLSTSHTHMYSLKQYNILIYSFAK